MITVEVDLSAPQSTLLIKRDELSAALKRIDEKLHMHENGDESAGGGKYTVKLV